MYKIIGADGRQYGPVATEELRRWMSEGRAGPHTMAQREGETEWKPLSAHSEFAADVKTPPPLLSSPASAGSAGQSTLAATASNKIAAGVCGILLGSFGIH